MPLIDTHRTDTVTTVRTRDQVYRAVTRLLAVLLVPVAYLVAPGRARHAACQWALSMRFPAEDLAGLLPAARAAFEAARSHALWRHGELIGLTSGYRDAATQAALYVKEVRRSGSAAAARRWTLPPHESRHVAGTAFDVRPTEGARWLERYGARYGLYRRYDNEWWHFEYCPEGQPERLPHPGAAATVAVAGAGTAPTRGIVHDRHHD
ncbi:D,D-peptidase/D,D-carboxypeptidase VanY-N [Micromonospora sp. WMMD812]|uniref:D,D-peptidase/D,D-carboxypeptidase VanY-N n=1 Tax=Micromonospora sp. WMMD812 TaxID=3015152 RepID=UPI00248C8D5D|nr:D,D-peptidase/D,D-carboxypeptidase VanY-N [Micromonospora sp. WMMD812]WBB67698.1 D,D-peptidase/D,D-carboxypeptidase VanY-N [Micromonospora sp. WMMD812]